MAAELPRPGVEVVQVFQAVSPTVITPTLVPCIIGVAKQLVELLETDAAGSSSLNTDANIQLAACFQAIDAAGGPPKVYTGLDGLALVLSVNLGPDVTVTFADTAAAGLTPASVVAQILGAFTTAGVTAATAEVLGDAFRICTIGVGEFQTLTIQSATAPAVATAFGFGIGQTHSGLTNYLQNEVTIPEADFPDPRGNLDELVIEAATIRLFLATGNGTSIQEMLRDTAFCTNGTVNDFAATSVTSGIDLAGITMSNETLTLFLNGSVTSEDILFVVESGIVPILGVLNPILNPLGFTATTDGSGFLVITSDSPGADFSIQITAAGGGQATLGLEIETVTGFNIEVTDDGNGDAVSPILRFEGEDFTATPTAATISGTSFSSPSAGETLIISDGQQPQTITFAGGESNVDTAALIETIMGAAVGGRLLTDDDTTEVRFAYLGTGTDAIINIIGGTAVGTIGHAVGITYATVRSQPEPGDELWIDGAFIGIITQVAPGGAVDEIKIDTQLTISSDIGDDFFIIAKNLPGVTGRPAPDLVVDLVGQPTIKQELLRDVQGNRVSSVAPIYMSYTAVRQDVSPRAERPGLLRFNDTTSLDDALSPLNTDNPLGLGLFFALLNAPGVQVTGLGVSAISADSPLGTVEAFTEAAEYLEQFEVYALAPLTHDETVAQVFNTHVNLMSSPEQKGERIVLFNPDQPTTKRDTVVASGTDGDTIGAGGVTFDTKITNLTTLIQNAGVSPVGTIPVGEGLFLDIASDALNYSITSVAGSVVTVKITFATGENDDSFYSTSDLNDPPLLSALISESFSVKIRGAELVTVDGVIDKDGIAETVALVGQAFLNRRFWMTIPDTALSTIEGLEQSIDGFYLNAAISGMIGQNPPQQSFTNFPMTGFTGVVGSSNFFSESQMNAMAAGGAYIIIQEAPGAPLIARFALTTDLTSIETRTDSITKVVDFTAKFLRRGLKNFIGRFNITQGFLDSLGTTIQGLLGFLVETGVLIGADLNNIVQDEDAPDTVLIDVTLDVPFPANFIRLTLVV